jgi:hypothetical protein
MSSKKKAAAKKRAQKRSTKGRGGKRGKRGTGRPGSEETIDLGPLVESLESTAAKIRPKNPDLADQLEEAAAELRKACQGILTFTP